MTLVLSKAGINPPVISNQSVARIKTTKMLKILKILFPTERWDKDKLHKEARDKIYSFGHGTVRCLGQPDGRGTEFEWEIRVNREWAEALIQARNKADAEEQGLVKAETFWNGMVLRSPSEMAVAEALQRKRVLFFVNAKCRLCSRLGQLETWETDFLVFYQGIPRILEVDGRAYHQDFGADYKRDRMFDREGIRSSRFSASECLNNADEVVKEFLELFNPIKL
jgi:very-short-patch-repair endonuclease